MALIEDFDKFARDFLNNENMGASNPTTIEEDVEIIQASEEEIDVIMNKEPIVIEIDEPLVDIAYSGDIHPGIPAITTQFFKHGRSLCA